MGTFVLGNLDGEAIANKSSAWAPTDFESHRSVFHEAFSLKFDPTVDWLSRSYRMDGRGLMAESACYIEQGRLQRPVASLKAARQLSCLPTPVPSASGISLSSALEQDLDEAIRALDQGVIVPDVLGMHTQDASRGAYSLSVPSALLVKNGKIIGRRRATLAGNFFDDLASPITSLKSPIYDMVGLGLTARLNF
jgi:predicted Zn-dependent protease